MPAMNPEKRLTLEDQMMLQRPNWLRGHGLSQLQQCTSFYYPEVFRTFEPMATEYNMDVNLYIAKANYPDAMAVDAYNIVVTKPMIDLLNKDELRAVLAHELAHCKYNAKHQWMSATPLIGGVGAYVMSQLALESRPVPGNVSQAFSIKHGVSVALGAIAYHYLAKSIIPMREHEADREGVRVSEDAANYKSALEKLQAFAKAYGVTSTGYYPSYEERYKNIIAEGRRYARDIPSIDARQATGMLSR